jgi:hypothetical protein
MAPYLLVPIAITNSEAKEKEAEARIQPNDISYHYPGFYNGTVVVTKSGSSYLVLLTPEAFDNLLDAYHMYVRHNAGKFGTLSFNVKPANGGLIKV